MVDAVVTWVDGTDPTHARKRSAYAEETDWGKAEPGAGLPTRFHSFDEVRLCILSIRQFAPWIDRIFLVTDDQCPAWLDAACRTRLGVTVVDHSIVFRGYENCLPTFSSRSIESVLHRIPEIGERFVYFNDDFFLIRSTTIDDFFEGTVPRIRGKLFWRPRLVRKIQKRLLRKSEVSHGMVKIRLNGVGRLPLSVTRLVQLGHSPYPVLRDRMQWVMDEGDRIASNVRFRFRNKEQFSCFCLYASLEATEGRVRVVPPDGLYAHPDLPHLTEGVLSALRTSEAGPHHACIQSLDSFEEPDRSALLTAMDYLRSTCQ